MIADGFEQKYQGCVIPARPEYSFGHSVSHTVFSTDCVYRKGRGRGDRCDEFIFFDLSKNLTAIYLVERKDTGMVNAKSIQAQLQGGAKFVAKFLHADPAMDAYKSDFMPVLVSHDLRPTTLRQLLTETVCMHNKNKRIRHVQKGGKLPKFKHQKKK